MAIHSMMNLFLYFLILLLLAKPLAWYMTAIYEGKPVWINTKKGFSFLEVGIYRLASINENDRMNWKTYLVTMIFFNICGILFLYFLQRMQYILPLNPQKFYGIDPQQAFNTAISFTTNTDWQAYSGESSLSYLTQMLGMTVQHFLSAATGLSIGLAVIRGIQAQESSHLGNYWVDMVRTVIYILLPLSIFLALILSSQGVIQNLKPYEKVNLLQTSYYLSTMRDSTGKLLVDDANIPKAENLKIQFQVLPMGPVASQVAIKQLGSNGGGYFNTNAAHPFENPNSLTNFIEMIAILLIPTAFCFCFANMMGDKRIGRSMIAVMMIMIIPCILTGIYYEKQGNPILEKIVNLNTNTPLLSHDNLEGKETRFGVFDSVFWSSLSTAGSHASSNSSLDSYTPLAGMLAFWLVHSHGVIFGAVGSGLYNSILYMILSAFLISLLIGRSADFLGKKIDSYELKMASFAVIILPITILIFVAIAISTDIGMNAIANPMPHGFTEILYNLYSMACNNGTAFASLKSNSIFYSVIAGLLMLGGRYWMMIAVLALAGSMARKKRIIKSDDSFVVYTLWFSFCYMLFIFCMNIFTFVPVALLGPIVENAMMWGHYAT